jgi:hypothetical protein
MKKFVLVLAAVAAVFSVKAQEVSVGADVVSSYVWRGAYQTTTAIQPSLGFSTNGFSLTAWGSSPISNEAALFAPYGKEFDLTASYEIAGLSLAVTDYWWAGEGALEYFMYSTHRTSHIYELTLGYTLPVEKFPLSLSWNTWFAGSDYNNEDGKRLYSSYFELAYPFKVKDISLDAALGLTPWEGAYASKLSVINLSLKATKEIKITDSFTLPVFGQVITNPRSEDIFFVFGLSF